MDAVTYITKILDATPTRAYSNNELATMTGYRNSTISSAACRLHEAGSIRRIGSGVWQSNGAATAAVAAAGAPTEASPATVAAMDHVRDERNWFEIKVTRAGTTPAGFDYQSITDRNGRTGIVTWDA